MNVNQLPQTDSIRELASFWDAHDLMDFAEQLEEVKEPAFVRDAEIALQVSQEAARRVQELAESRGITANELIQQWIDEKIQRT